MILPKVGMRNEIKTLNFMQHSSERLLTPLVIRPLLVEYDIRK